MHRFTRILAGTDFSLRATAGVRRAARLAHEHRAALRVVHVARPKEPRHPVLELAALLQGAHERPEGEAEERLRATGELLHSHFNIDVSHEFKVGQAHEEIAGCAESYEADLIVIGAHGEHFIADLLVGATTSRLLRSTAKPVLVVRLNPTEPYTDVVVGIDFSPSSRSTLPYAKSLAPTAAIWALHVLETKRSTDEAGQSAPLPAWRSQTAEARTLLERFVQQFDSTPPMRLVEAGYPPQVICDASARMKVGLICIGKHGLHETNPALLGSVAKHVLECASCDVAIVST